MSTTKEKFAIQPDHEDEPSTFDDETDFWSTKQLLDESGIDYEIVDAPENGSKSNGQADQESENHQGESEITDGGTNAESNDVEIVNDQSDLPDRELTEDPIAWLQEGDGELTTQIDGTTVITKKGFRVLQHNYDISTGSEVVVGPEDTNHEFCRVKAWAKMPDGRRAEAHASAHTDRGDDHFLLVSMADTRAKSRALSDVTGVGAVAIEEMMGVEKDA